MPLYTINPSYVMQYHALIVCVNDHFLQGCACLEVRLEVAKCTKLLAKYMFNELTYIVKLSVNDKDEA